MLMLKSAMLINNYFAMMCHHLNIAKMCHYLTLQQYSVITVSKDAICIYMHFNAIHVGNGTKCI